LNVSYLGLFLPKYWPLNSGPRKMVQSRKIKYFIVVAIDECVILNN
jgi:hypothetical protein